MVLAVTLDWEVDHLDVKTVFLNPTLNEEIYMEIPNGYDWLTGDNRIANKVLKLRKSLYGLKQAPREWYQDIDTYLTKNLQFERSTEDSNLYQRNDCFLLLYVDDILIFSPKKRLDVKQSLMNKYKMTDLGPAQLFLGIQIVRNRAEKTIFLHQTRYIDTVLKRFGMEDVNDVYTPLPAHI